MLKKLRIGRKLMVTFMLVAIISSIGGIVGLIQMTNMNSDYSNALTDYGFSQGDVGRLSSEFNNNRAIIRNIIIYTDTESMLTESHSLDKSSVAIEADLAKVQKSLLTETEKGYYKTITENLVTYKDLRAQVVKLALANEKTEAQTLLITKGEPLLQKITVSINALFDEKTKKGQTISSSLSSEEVTATLVIFFVILASFVFSLFIALSIARGISKPVKELEEAAQKLAQGDLGVQIHVNSADEIGRLGTAFSETAATLKTYITDISTNLAIMAQGNMNIAIKEDFKGDFEELKFSIDGIVVSFNDAITQIKQASEQVSSGSDQVSNGAQVLSQGAMEQAGSIEELSATITEISTHVKDNAEYAANASINVNQVRSEIETSNQHMNDMVTAMSQINDSSSQIGRIIKTIEDIAFQTNILALNAAVEAARAGSAGKGFAVVADEVRNLASKSAQAAKNTSSLIENSIRQVENGTRIADETAKSLLRVVDSAKVVSDTVQKISQASIRQSDAIVQVILGVDQISAVVQTNSATAEESAAASEELSGQAQILKELVQKFKLTDQTIEIENTQNQCDQSEPLQKGLEEIISNSILNFSDSQI